MVVFRTYSAPSPSMRGRMNLIQSLFDDESNEFVKPDDSNARVPRTRSYNLSSSCRINDGRDNVTKKPALPMIQRRGRNLQTKNVVESSKMPQPQQATLSRKRQKPRFQSGAAVQNIQNSHELKSYASKKTNFPVQIRDRRNLSDEIDPYVLFQEGSFEVRLKIIAAVAEPIGFSSPVVHILRGKAAENTHSGQHSLRTTLTQKC